MKLRQLLATLITANVQVTLVDLDSGTEITSLKSTGYASLEDTIESREVKQWSIVSATHINVVLGEVINEENNNDPQNP